MRLLIVDDEVSIRAVVKEYAHFNHYEIDEASDGLMALEMLKKAKYDLIILDLMMPDLDGFSTYDKLRKFCDTKVLILSARNEEYDKLYLYEKGIEDYITKPFSPKELFAKIKVILNRHNDNDIYKYEEITFSYKARSLIIEGKKIELTPKEFDLLAYFIANKGRVLAREELLEKIWSYDYIGNDRTIDTHVKMLRKNLGKYKILIKTIFGIGYKFEENL